MVDVAKYEPVPKAFYRLRWRFDFVGGKTKRGVWNLISESPLDKACNVDKTGLLFAMIEGENLQTFEQKILFECSGDDYVSCQGEAYVRVPRAIGLQGTVKPRVNLSGVSFITRTEKVTVHVNGTVSRRPLTEHEKKFDIYEHRLGSGVFR